MINFRGIIGNLIVFFLIVLAVNAVTTQYVAYHFQYNIQLGNPVLGKFYWPWQWLFWAHKFYSFYEEFFGKMYLFTGLGFGLCVFINFLIYHHFIRRVKGNEVLYGSANWAKIEDVEKAGLLSGQGLYVGGMFETKKGYAVHLRYDGPSNYLAVAPTRAGKGVGPVLSTLLSWKESAFVNDIKGENYALTAGYQKHLGKNIFKFDPGNSNGMSAKFNPLDYIRVGTTKEVGDTQELCLMLIDDTGDAFEGANAHWNNAAYSLATGLVLHIKYVEKLEGAPASLSMLRSVINRPESEEPEEGEDKGYIKVFKEIRDYPHTKDGPHSTIAESMQEVLNKADKERDSVVSTLLTKLVLYADPIVAANTEYSEFKIEDLMDADKPSVVYNCCPPSQLKKFRPLSRMMLALFVARLTEEMKFEGGRGIKMHKHRLLMLLDEFPAMGRVDIVQTSMAFTAGYHIIFMLFVQNMGQLWNAYGENEEITGNCHIMALYPTLHVKTAEWISSMAGVTTAVDETETFSGSRFGSLNHRSINKTKVQRPLVTPDEVMQLPGPIKKGTDVKVGGTMLVYSAGFPMIKCIQTLYFQEDAFLDRAKISAPEESDKLYSRPLFVKKEKLKLKTGLVD